MGFVAYFDRISGGDESANWFGSTLGNLGECRTSILGRVLAAILYSDSRISTISCGAEGRDRFKRNEMKRKLPVIVGIALIVTGCQVAGRERPRSIPLASLSNEQLWNVWVRYGATQELMCENISRRDAERLLDQRYGAQERRIAERLGEKTAEERILTLPPCSFFRGATDRYADSLRELERRLTTLHRHTDRRR